MLGRMAEPTESAVIVPIASAEAAVGGHRLRFDEAASQGVPAHVTVVYPFVPPLSIDESVLRRLTAVCAAARSFDCSFNRCRWFGDQVLWLAPDPDQDFRNLTAAVVHEFPAHPPYEGAFDDLVPHLTVGQTGRATASQLRAAEAEIRPQLPITCRVEHALLIARTSRPRPWRVVAELPLGSS